MQFLSPSRNTWWEEIYLPLKSVPPSFCCMMRGYLPWKAKGVSRTEEPENCGQEWEQFSLSQKRVGLCQVVQVQPQNCVCLLEGYRATERLVICQRVSQELFVTGLVGDRLGLGSVVVALQRRCESLHHWIRRTPRYMLEGSWTGFSDKGIYNGLQVSGQCT